jgi:rod shape determining protein RodA
MNRRRPSEASVAFMTRLTATAVFALAALGFLGLSSAVWRHPEGPMLIAKQIAWLACGGLVGLWFYRTPFSVWMERTPIIFAAAMAILAAGVAISRNFPDSHIPSDPSYMQLTELVALPVMLMAARVLQGDKQPSLSFNRLALVLAVSALPVTLLLFMPGDTIILAYIVMVLMSLIPVGVHRWAWLGMVWGINVVMAFRLMQRPSHIWMPFPLYLPSGRAVHKATYAFQGMLALSGGSFFGKGFGNGDFCQCCWFDDLHTGFLFASFGEEFGFLGVAIALGLFALVTINCLRASRWAGTKPQTFVAAAVGWFVAFHVLMHAGAVSLLVPAKCYPLPLFSSGPATMAFSAMLAIALRVTKECRSTFRL